MSEPRRLREVPLVVNHKAVEMLEKLLEEARAGKWSKVLVFIDGPDDSGWRSSGHWSRPELLYATELARHDVVTQ